MAWRFLALLATLAGLTSAAPASACSVGSDYVRPTNFELVQIADAIVIATPEPSPGDGPEEGLTFRVQTAIKGAPPQRLRLAMAFLGRTMPSDLADLSGSHPEGHAGPCNRTSFARGGRYLLFLARRPDGSWQQLGYVFSRINEDYAGEDNAWMRSVRRYLLLQRSLAPMEQIAALARMAETGRDGDGRALAESERADISEHLSAISPWKPTAWLLDLYARLERGEPFGARPDSANRERSDADALASLAMGEPQPSAPPEMERERMLVLRALADGDHPGALPLFERFAAAPETGPRLRGLILRFLARNGHYPRAYQWIETRLFTALPRLNAVEAHALLADVALAQQGDSYDEGRERWRTDPHAAATWPELALALYHYQTGRFGERGALRFSDAIGAIPVTDYRARPELTLALLYHFDRNVRPWAVAELARPSGASGAGADDLFPLRILASTWMNNDDPALIRAFCEGGERRRLVILALGQWGSALHMGLMARMAATPGLSREERSGLLRAAIEMTARDIRENGEALFLSEEAEDNWLLTRLVRGRPVGAAPLSCRG